MLRLNSKTGKNYDDYDERREVRTPALSNCGYYVEMTHIPKHSALTTRPSSLFLMHGTQLNNI